MSISDPVLLQQREGGLLRLTLNRAERRNALNEALIRDLTQAVLAVENDPSLHAILLTASGTQAFCAGADLNPKAGTFAFDYASPTTDYAQLLRALQRVNVPIIGRINGHCLAGGMGLLASCDIAIAADHAKFGLPEVKVGVFPMQVAALLQRRIPPQRFAQLCYTAALIPAQEAQDLGLVLQVVPSADLDQRVEALLAQILANSPTAIRRGKHALRAIADMSLPDAIAHMEAQAGLMVLTKDAAEGQAAFAEKRPPVWTGK